MVVVVVQGVTLFLAHRQAGKAPDAGIGHQPPISDGGWGLPFQKLFYGHAKIRLQNQLLTQGKILLSHLHAGGIIVGRPPLGLAGIGYLQKRCCHHLVTVLQPAISHLRVRRSLFGGNFSQQLDAVSIAQKEVISLPDLFHKCLALGFFGDSLGFRSTVNRNHMPVFQNWLYSIGNASGTRPVADFPQGRGSVLVFGGSVYFFRLLIFFQTVPADVKAHVNGQSLQLCVWIIDPCSVRPHQFNQRRVFLQDFVNLPVQGKTVADIFGVDALPEPVGGF